MKLLFALPLAISIYIVHEAAHYYTAKLFGWTPHVKFIRSGWRTGFGVKISENEDIDSIDEVPIICKKLLYFGASGFLGIIPAILFSLFLNEDLSQIVILLLLYSLYETLVITDFNFLKQLQLSEICEDTDKEAP